MRDAFIARLGEEAARDARVMFLTGDLGFGVIDNFARTYPRQFLNVGVAEQNLTGIATGLALEGRIVFTYSIANFPTLRCLEQIRNDAAYHNADVKVVAIGGGFSYGALGISHHATEDLAILRALPDITVLSPGCDWEAAEATSALVRTPGTAYLRLDRSSTASTARPGEKFEVGRARVLMEGTELSLICTGGILSDVLAAAKQLGEHGTHVRVVSMASIAPLDAEAVLECARETGGIITVEEHSVVGGLGGAVAEVLADARVVPARWKRMGLQRQFSSIVGSQQYLRTRYGIDAAAITRTAQELMQASSSINRPESRKG